MYKPVKLSYDYSALEPFIDVETMKVHYDTLYMNYIKNLNDEMQKNTYRSVPIKKLIATIDNYSDYMRNNAGGYYNHSLFWKMLKPNKTNNSNLPSGMSKKLIDRDFGSYNVFKKMIEAKAKKRFGSGWVWWIIMPNGYTRIIETPYQDNPQMYFNCEILLGVDVWEHAYFLKYQADRKGYVNNIFNVVNWNYANESLN